MKKRIRFAITLAGAVLCALPNFAMAQSDPGNSQGGQAAAIEGTWIETISSQGVTLFTGLQSFTADGSLVSAGSYAPGSSFGSWTRVDNKTYVASFYFYNFSCFAISPSVCVSAGSATGTTRVNVTLTVSDDGNSLNGPATVFTCDLNVENCVVSPPPVTIKGKRLITHGA